MLTIAPAFAFNWAMGRAAIKYFKHPGMSRELMKEVFKKAQTEAKSHFSKDAFDRFRKQNAQDLSAVANKAKASAQEEEEQEEAEAPAPKQKTRGKKAAEEPEEAEEDEALTVRGLIEQELPPGSSPRGPRPAASRR